MKWFFLGLVVATVAQKLIQARLCIRDFHKGYFYE